MKRFCGADRRRKATARLALNEISPLRRECLGVVFPEATVTGFDGELIDELLTPDVGPSAVLMNPPYSRGIERGHDSRTGDRHLRSAWKRLTRRLIVGRDGRQVLQSRSPRANVAETRDFMDGTKRILVFSDAGGTGRSYHADLAAKNQMRRVHFLLEPGWRADAAIQGLGRTNRTNQASAPLFRPVTTDVRGERRFISTIARRLDSLGALTRGQRQTGGVETIAVEHYEVVTDTLLRSDALSGATTHLLELEIARALKPLRLERLEELYGFSGSRQQLLRNARSGRIGLLVPARSLLTDEGMRVARFELVRPLKHGHITADQLAESSWETVDSTEFRRLWQAEVDDAASNHKRERLHLATGLLLPVWDKLPSDYVRVSRISARDGRSLLGREVPLHCVPELCQALGLEDEHAFSAEQIVDAVIGTGRPMQIKSREALTLKRSLVNGAQRLELAGWSASRLDWYKTHGCFTEIIRYQTRLFVPTTNAVAVLARLAGLN